MDNLEKIWTTWSNLEDVYNNSGTTSSKSDFLKGLTSDSAIAATKDMVEQTLQSNDVSAIESYNRLINLLQDIQIFVSKQKLAEDTNLDNFVSTFLEKEVNVFSLEDYSVLSDEKYSAEETLIHKGVFGSKYTLQENSKVLVERLNPNSDIMIHISDNLQAIVWLHAHSKDVTKDNFIATVYAYLAKTLAKKESISDLTFINQDKVKVPDAKEIYSIEISDNISTTDNSTFFCNSTLIRLCVSSVVGNREVFAYNGFA